MNYNITKVDNGFELTGWDSRLGNIHRFFKKFYEAVAWIKNAERKSR